MPERVALVTGAAGFIGRSVARALADQGFVVHGLGHGAPSDTVLRSSGITHWSTGAVGRESLERWGNRPDVVIHCAGPGTVAAVSRDPLEDFSRTVRGTAELLDYLNRQAGDSKVVFCSSAAVYGQADPSPIRVDRVPKPISAYGFHKLLMEQLMAEWSTCFGLRVAVVRLFSVYGEGLRKQLLWDASRKFRMSKATFGGTGAETRDWVHVNDAVRLLLLAAEQASTECPVVNGGTGVGPTVAEVLQHLANCLHLGPTTVPRFSGELRSSDPLHLCADIGIARSWGWRPEIDWRTGIERYASWYTRDGDE
jgi:UDP-glucose 4-epimerase